MLERPRENINLRFFLLQASIAAMSCVGVGFISPILISFGYGALDIGIAMTLAAFASAFAKPIWGHIQDKYSYSREIVLIVNAFGCFFYILLVFSNGAHGIVEFAVIGLISTIMSMMNFIDSWAMRLISDGYQLNFGATRSAGSLSYAITGITFGFVMSRYGVNPGITIMITLFILQYVIVSRIPNPRKRVDARNPELSNGVEYLKRNKPYLLLLLSFFLGSIPMSATESFFPLLVTELGGSEQHIGIGFFLQAMSEIPVLFFYNRIKRKLGKNPAFFLAIGLGFYGIKCIGMGLAPTYQIALVMTLLNGLSFGLVLSASIDFILKYVHHNYLATAYLFSSALGLSLGAVIGNFVNGLIAEKVGVSNMMLIASTAAILSVLIISYSGKVKEPGIMKGK